MPSYAIVGNSKVILEKEWGSEIDQHDFVVRFNTAVTENFEKFVGSKTNIRFCNLHIVNCLVSESHLKEHTQNFPEWNSNAILDWKNQALYFKNVHGTLESSYLHSHFLKNGNSINHIPDSIVRNLENRLGADPTMGILAIDIISRISNDISCYGFDFYKTIENFHYYEKVVPYNQTHSKHGEYEYFNKLTREGKIRERK
jgi:hypothetical protein